MAGLYLEDFTVGQVFDHAIRRSVLESDNMAFCNMTMNPQPLHIDHDFCARMPWGKPAINSFFTLSLLMGLSVYETTLGTTIANLGMQDVAFPHPVFHGDTIHAQSEVISISPSRSKLDRGVVEFEHRAFNQHNQLVARCRRQAMMMTRPQA